jgi:hypothetical protein
MRLRQSLVVFAAVMTVAVIGLAIEGNGPKVLRVGAAAAVYACTLLALTRSVVPSRQLGWWRFAAAGTAAGIISGLLRPEPGGATIAIDVLAAVVLATAHSGSLVLSEQLRRKIAA